MNILFLPPAPDFDKTCWFDHKFSYGLDFPNLPYYMDGQTKLTQTHAIMRYIARKHDLCGKVTLVILKVLDLSSLARRRRRRCGWT